MIINSLNSQFLANYLKKFTHLRVDVSKGIAPHKPILLLSIFDTFDAGLITENKIFITPELVATFRKNWSQFVTSTHIPNFVLPFFHLRSSGFWTLVTVPGVTIPLTKSHSIRSFAALKESIEYAKLAEDLFFLLTNPENRLILRKALLQRWFPDAELNSAIDNLNSYITDIEKNILSEPAKVYKLQSIKLDEEEKFIRGGFFKKVIPREYNYTCSVSGLQIAASNEVTMIDVCHIVPFSISNDDTISNGFTLCPNLHRAFDRHLFYIDDEYKVRVTNHFIESAGQDYGIKRFEGREILLPKNRNYWPRLENFKKQRSYF